MIRKVESLFKLLKSKTKKDQKVEIKRNKITESSISLVSLCNQSIIAEKYRTIRTNIQFSAIDKDLNTLVVTSPGPNEGTSITAANLAIAFANTKKQILLVDADLRNPTIAMTFHLPTNEGLSNLLSDYETTADEYILKTNIENLWILPSGPKPPNPSEILETKRMEEMIAKLSIDFDLIIFDVPPVAIVTDAQILASKTDGTLIIVRERMTEKKELVKAKELLEIAKANVLGVIYNGAQKDSELSYYYQELQ